MKKNWFWKKFFDQKAEYLQAIVGSICINLLAVSSAFYIMIVYDRVIPNNANETLITLTIGVLIIFLFEFLMKIVRGKLIDNAGKKIDKLISSDIFDLVSNQANNFNQKKVGHVSSIFRDFEMLKEFVSSAILVSLVDFPFLIFFLIIIYLIGGSIAIVPGIIVLILILISLLTHPILKKISFSTLHLGHDKHSFFVELLSSIETISFMPGASEYKKKWLKIVENQSENFKKSRTVNQLVISISQFFQQFSSIGIIFVGALLIENSNLTMGSLIACVILSGRCMAPLGQTTSLLNKLSNVINAYKSIDNIINEYKNSYKIPQIFSLDEKINIKFENVYFKYPGKDNLTLENINFNIVNNDKIAFVGPVGSGKSTILKLICGLIYPQNGKVSLSNNDVSIIDRKVLKKKVIFINQSPSLFSGTIEENILLGNPEADRSDINKLIKEFNFNDVFFNFDKGLDTFITERGSSLSGGQIQVISLCRSLINKDAELIVMDEPTSDFDLKLEQTFVKSLYNFIQNKTLILVTHRAPLLGLVNNIGIIEKGKIMSFGPKDKLIKK